jgi:hypothetical protein
LQNINQNGKKRNNMKLWIVKDINFGYRYTTNKYIRKNIKDYFDNYLMNLLLKKSKNSDKFIISDKLFYNTNPSLVAISDATEYINKISKIIEVYLISSENNMRNFDGDNYSTLDLFKNNDNVNIVDSGIKLHNCIINNNTVEINANIIDIPNIIQYDIECKLGGILIYRTEDDKYMLMKNDYSPKHIIYEINSFEDFNNIDKGNDYIHLIINDNFYIENKTKLNLEIFKLNPQSVKYKNKVVENKTNITNFDISKTIYDAIGDNNDLKNQFDRILNITNKE